MENLGLVGFTGAGANRLFSALTGLPAPSEYEAAVGIATVPDERLDRLAVMSESKKVVPAGFELVHLALPPGAKPGEGLGAKFLGSLRNCDAILIVLRAFARRRGRARSRRRPRRARARARAGRPRQRRAAPRPQRKAVEGGDKRSSAEVAALERALPILSEGTPLYRADLDPADRALLGAGVPASRTSPCSSCATSARRRTRRADRRCTDRARSRCRSTSRPRSRRATPRTAPRCARCTASPSPRSTTVARRGVPPARPAHVPHDGRQGVAGVDVPRRCQGARVRGRDPLRPATRVSSGPR